MQAFVRVLDISKKIKDFCGKDACKVIIANKQDFVCIKDYKDLKISINDYLNLNKWDQEHIRIESVIAEAEKRLGRCCKDKKTVSQRYYEKFGRLTDYHTECYYYPRNFFLKTQDIELAVKQVLQIIKELEEDSGITELKKSCSPQKKSAVIEKVGVLNHTKNGVVFVNKKALDAAAKQEDKYISVKKIIKRFQVGFKVSLPESIERDFCRAVSAGKLPLGTLISGKSTVSKQFDNGDYLVLMEEVSNNRALVEHFFLASASTSEENYEIIKSYLGTRFPVTTEILSRYSADGAKKEQGQKALADLLFLEKEITEMSYPEKEDFLAKIIRFGKKREVVMEKLFRYAAEHYAKEMLDNSFVCLKSVKKQDSTPEDEKPYPYRSYVIMAGVGYCSDYWEKKKIIQRTIESRAFANIVLNIQFHYVSLWRSEDYCAITHVPMPEEYTVEELTEMIKSNTLTEEICKQIIERLEAQSALQKTLKTGESLVLCIPPQAHIPLATMLIINEYHRQKEGDESLINSNNLKNMRAYKDLLGERMVSDVLENVPFSNRRANHSYASKLAMVIENKTNAAGKFIGYLLVAYARSHKGSIYDLPGVTSHYLEAKSDGLSANEYMTEMFARGFCGFAAYMLLSAVLPEFDHADIKIQTKVLAKLGLKPLQIEMLAQRILECEEERDAFFDDLFQGHLTGKEFRKRIQEIIESIGTWSDESLEEGILCLKTAAGMRCPYREEIISKRKFDTNYNKCVFCRFAIVTRECFYRLVQIKENNSEMAEKEENENVKELFRQYNRKLINPALKAFRIELSIQGMSVEEIDKFVKEARNGSATFINRN